MLTIPIMEKKLRANGWEQLWHETNWVKSEWWDDPTINIDKIGRDVFEAYVMLTRELENGTYKK